MKKYTPFLFLVALLIVGFLGVFNPNTASADYLPGCNSEDGYSSTTGRACNEYFPDGCTSTAGYSPSTGIKCDIFWNNSGDDSGEGSGCVSLTYKLGRRAGPNFTPSRDSHTNGEVSLLQDFLQSQGYLHSETTGYFGLLTFGAV